MTPTLTPPPASTASLTPSTAASALDPSAIRDTLLAPAARQRVHVPAYGLGTTLSLRLWGPTILDYRIALDHGGTISRTPWQFTPLDSGPSGNVVPFQTVRPARRT